MSIRLIASVVIAALLLTGSAATVPRDSEYGAQAQQSTDTTPAVTTLTAQEAQAIALTHAGLTEAEVTQLRSTYDADDWVPEWEIEFRSGDWEYDYSIHAETGAIRDWDREYDPERIKEPTPTEPAVTEPPATEPVSTEPPVTEPPAAEITEQEAQAIALAHAGLTADQVRGLQWEYDWDDGRAEYEVEFCSGGWEYEYEIHAETGAILHSEKDRDD